MRRSCEPIVVSAVNTARTQNGHIRNDTRDVSRRIRRLRITSICSGTFVADDRACTRVTLRNLHGKEGSTVRVRQRALQKRRASALSRSDELALRRMCDGFGAGSGALTLAPCRQTGIYRRYSFSGMPDSVTKTISGQEKRKRLVEGAREVLHRQGVQKTTIADVAEAAGVPVGNVYYYFKTKEEIVTAVVDDHLQQVRALLARLDSRKTPRARLKGLTANWADAAPMVARSGCPLGSLCSELAKEEGDSPALGAEIFKLLSSWAEAQFRALGRRDAADLALMMLSTIQGAALLSNSFRDPRIMTRQVRQLDRWIDSLT